MKTNMSQQDEIANLLQDLDIPPIPAQIIGLLLLAVPPSLSFDEIGTRLSISKAAVSTGMRYLEALDMVRYRTTAGSRKRYVQVRPAQIVNYLRRRMFYMKSLTKCLQQVIKTRGEDSAYTAEIQSVADLCEELDREVMRIIDTWEQKRHE
jgi:DNA-binding transcriptional regulator GbsR (MarR family)